MELRVVHLDIMQVEVQVDLLLLPQCQPIKVAVELEEIVEALMMELQILVAEVAAMARLELLVWEVLV